MNHPTTPGVPVRSRSLDGSARGLRLGSLLLALTVSAGAADAQTLVRDVNLQPDPVNPSSAPGPFVTVGGTTFFPATDHQFGRELWKTDASGTSRVADINNGANASSPNELVALGTTLVFRAFTPEFGSELYISDGTAAGTTLLKDVAPGPSSRIIVDLTEAAGAVWFQVYDGFSTRELWRTDGTTNGTELFDVIDDLEILGNAGGLLYFAVGGSSPGLWRTDGTGAGTFEVAPLGNAAILEAVAWNGTLAFTRTESTPGSSLWTSDGTAAGTAQVSTLPAAPSSLTATTGRLVFVLDDGTHGRELWSSDGSTAGTGFVIDLRPGVFGSDPRDLAGFGGDAWFLATHDNQTHGFWRSDGTAAGTVLVQEIGNAPPTQASFAEQGGLVYFRGYDAAHGYELWSSDGTPAGTELVADVLPGTSNGVGQLFADGAHVYFAGQDGVTGSEPWRSDGTPAGTALVQDVAQPRLSLSSRPDGLARVRDKLFFWADDGVNGREPWISDGTLAGTLPLGDLNPGSAGSDPDEHAFLYGYHSIELGNTLLFTARGPEGIELWSTDGTPGGTALLAEFDPDGGGSDPQNFVRLGDFVYFAAEEGNFSNPELFRTDGTTAGTVQVSNLPGGAPTDIGEIAALNGKLLFSFDDGSSGPELWQSDGTPEGTSLLHEFNPGSGGGLPSRFSVVGSHLYFTALAPANGFELWRTDGTSAGTEIVFDANPAGSGFPRSIIDVADQAVFFSWPGVGFDRALFATDGPGTTLQLAAIEDQGSGTRTALGLDSFGLAWGNDGTGFGLWRTDGTAFGTELVAPFPSIGTTNNDLTRVGSGPHVLFQATDDGFGAEAWVSDGTSIARLTDVAPGATPSQPEKFVRVGSRVFFAADDNQRGIELHALSFPSTGGWVAEPFGLGCVGANGLRPRMTVGGAATLGGTLEVGVEDAFASTLGVLFFSPNRQFVELGVGGCTSYVGTPLFTRLAATSATGTATRSFPVPNDPDLIGAEVHFQWAIVEPTGPFLGTTLSDGLEVIVGP